MTDAELRFALRVYCRRRPFEPFEIALVCGRRLRVAHPDWVGQFGPVFLFRGAGRTQALFAASSVSHLLDLSPAAG